MTLWSRRRDYLRLYGHEERQGFYERLDSFASAARAAPSCVTAAGCFRKRASLARGGRVNRQPRIRRRISKRFGGCGSNPSQQQRPRDGRNAISGSWSRRRDLNPRPLGPEPRRNKACMPAAVCLAAWLHGLFLLFPHIRIRVCAGALKKSALGRGAKRRGLNRSTNKNTAERSLCGAFGRGDGI